jgi:iron-sulfur cluster assembly protein
MLVITENARQAIETIMANAGAPEGAGVRIDAPDEPPAPAMAGVPLQLEVATRPAEQDEVIDEGGARVFVAPKVAPILEDKVLDVQVGDGNLQFRIEPQGRQGEQAES